ncbi:sulfotransferase [Novosphingobium tardum]|uniref:Sulfotransferase n=1 Tax=Novosphingobium tardum TaxID=1538021 RepID=A0ABV8RNP2_9SPHN
MSATISPATAETMQTLAGLARAGRLDEAALMAARVTADNRDPALAALAGAIESHRGQFERAAAYLQTAHLARPDDVTIRANLIEALYRTDRSAEALALVEPAAARADRTSRIARIGAHLAQEAGDFARAEPLHRLVVERDPHDWGAWNNLGNALGPLGRHAEAVEALRRAAQLAPDSPPIRLNFGNALAEAGEGEECEKVLRDLAADFPDDPQALVTLFALLRASGREDEAYEAIAEAARRAPADAGIRSDHGQDAARRNMYDVAEREFEAALAIEPGLGPSYVGLASVYERVNREAELEPLRERAGANGTDDQTIAYIDALRHKRAGRVDEAFAALEQSGDVVVPGRKHHLRGTMLDRLGRHEEAFAEFEAMNTHWREDPVRPLERAAQYRRSVEHARDLLSRSWADSWRDYTPADGRTAPVFVLGFPRSGTTLLDTMLMTDPVVGVLEEEPLIAEVERDLGGVDAFPTLARDQIDAARSRYFERAGDFLQLRPETRIVDKHPLHLNKVATIRRVFPEARFVLALRHPCDVILSCFLTNFRPNAAMANFLDLDDAARLYDLTFGHWLKACEAFDLPVRTVVYERLVQDTERELRPVFDWLDLAWPESEFDHREAARARGAVATASYAQVTEPVYQRARGRWRNYERELERVFPILAPWVERFGYSLEDDRIPDWPVGESATA